MCKYVARIEKRLEGTLKGEEVMIKGGPQPELQPV